MILLVVLSPLSVYLKYVARLSRCACSRHVAEFIGWLGRQAAVRDLWQHKDLGVMTAVTAALAANGQSATFKLTKA